jgi:hypothetical protein
MNKHTQLAIVGGIIVSGISAVALAQHSEYQAKIQEDLDGYKDRIVSGCKTAPDLTLRWEGKLEGNPRDSEREGWNAISSLCTAGTDAIYNTCTDNKAVQRALGSLKRVVCTRGKGTMSYRLAKGTITFIVDPSFTKNNIAGQEQDLVVRLKKDLDR